MLQWHHSMGAVIPVQSQYLFKENGGTSFPIEYIEKASEELESLVKILLREGINVVRPDNYSHQNTFSINRGSNLRVFIQLCREIQCLYMVMKLSKCQWHGDLDTMKFFLIEIY